MCPAKARVLIVEDDPDWLSLVEAELEKGGHRVACMVGRFEEAVRVISGLGEEEIDVALLDQDLGPGKPRGGDALAKGTKKKIA